MSIIPGMENFEPERTDTRRGFFASPNFIPIAASTFFRLASTWSHMPVGYFFLFSKYELHASVVMVNPAGTGIFRFVMLASPAPFPPSRSFIFPDPSAFPFPK